MSSGKDRPPLSTFGGVYSTGTKLSQASRAEKEKQQRLSDAHWKEISDCWKRLPLELILQVIMYTVAADVFDAHHQCVSRCVHSSSSSVKAQYEGETIGWGGLERMAKAVSCPVYGVSHLDRLTVADNGTWDYSSTDTAEALAKMSTSIGRLTLTDGTSHLQYHHRLLDVPDCLKPSIDHIISIGKMNERVELSQKLAQRLFQYYSKLPKLHSLTVKDSVNLPKQVTTFPLLKILTLDFAIGFLNSELQDLVLKVLKNRSAFPDRVKLIIKIRFFKADRKANLLRFEASEFKSTLLCLCNMTTYEEKECDCLVLHFVRREGGKQAKKGTTTPKKRRQPRRPGHDLERRINKEMDKYFDRTHYLASKSARSLRKIDIGDY